MTVTSKLTFAVDLCTELIAMTDSLIDQSATKSYSVVLFGSRYLKECHDSIIISVKAAFMSKHTAFGITLFERTSQ